MKVPRELLDYIDRNDEFVIATHINPEGDALGSSIALHLALKQTGKRSTVFCKDTVPHTYEFLPFHEVVRHDLPDVIERLVLLDCNSPERSGLESCVIKASAVIDHHTTTNNFGDIKWIKPDSPATGLMVFYLIKKLGVSISEAIASNLYTALAIDTGIFRFSNTTSDCMIVAAKLVREGANPALIAERLFNNYSRNRFLLLKEMLNTVEIHNGICVSTVTAETYERTGTAAHDTENFVNYPMLMDDIKISVLFRQIENGAWKISLRSKGVIDIASVAADFGGGGHRNAAGCILYAPLGESKSILLARLRGLVN